MLTFTVFDAAFEYDESDPEPYRGGQIAHWTDSPDPDDNVRVRRGENLDYWDGELG
jgi:hypothetical protein